MRNKQLANAELKHLLQAGYKLQETNRVFKIHRVSRPGEAGYSEDKSWEEYLGFGASGHTSYENFTKSIRSVFADFGLDFKRFISKTETLNPKTEPDSPAAILVKQLRELETIVAEAGVFNSYVLPKTNNKIDFNDGVISQGLAEHSFRDNQYRKLLHILWNERQIVTSKGKILKAGKPIKKSEIYKKLQIDHERFKDIVRGIKIEMKRKDIALDIKYPKDVLMIATQNSV